MKKTILAVALIAGLAANAYAQDAMVAPSTTNDTMAESSVHKPVAKSHTATTGTKNQSISHKQGHHNVAHSSTNATTNSTAK